MFRNHKTIFSIVDEPPSWSDVDDSLESMSEPEEEEEDSDGDFFDAGEAVIDDRVSSRAASKSGQSEGDTEDSVGPMTPGPTIVTSSTPVKATASGKSHTHAVSFTRTISASTEGDLDDEEWVDPTPIPATPLDTTPPSKAALFQKSATDTSVPVARPRAPAMAKSKSSSSTSGKSRKHRKEARAPLLSPSVSIPFPSSSPPPSSTLIQTASATTAGGDYDGEDQSRRIPQMSTARARDGGRTQSGGVKGVIAPFEQPGPGPEPEPEPGPELELVEADDPEMDDF